jgi:hypothetical protein
MVPRIEIDVDRFQQAAIAAQANHIASVRPRTSFALPDSNG